MFDLERFMPLFDAIPSDTAPAAGGTPPAAAPPPATPPAAEPPATEPPTTEAKAYTQAEIDEIIKARLLRQEKSIEKTVREKLEAEAAEATRLASLSAEQKLQEERDRLSKELETVRADATKEKRAAADLVSLAGKVTNPERVMRLIGDEAAYRTEAGALNLEAVLKDFPEYAGQDSSGTVIPSLRSTAGVPLTRASIEAMSSEEYEKSRVAIQQAQREGRIK